MLQITIFVIFLTVLGISCKPIVEVGVFFPDQKINAEDFASIQGEAGLQVCEEQGGGQKTYAVDIMNPAANVLWYKDVYFSEGIEAVTVRASGFMGAGVTGIINFHLDSQFNPFFASVPIQQVDGIHFCTFVTITNFVYNVPTGIHDVYVTFTSTENQHFTYLDWFEFKSSVV